MVPPPFLLSGLGISSLKEGGLLNPTIKDVVLWTYLRGQSLESIAKVCRYDIQNVSRDAYSSTTRVEVG